MNAEFFITKNQEKFKHLLAEFIKFADYSETGQQIDETVNFLTSLLKQLLGAEVEIHHDMGGSPVIIATLSPGQEETYLFYGHYDVQTVGNISSWLTDPFELTEKDGRLYGRGTGDNKGQLMAQICGFYVYQQIYGKLPFTVRLFIEGEEESGSPHLADYINSLKNGPLSDIKAAFVVDGSISQSGKHVLRLGNRGVLGFRLTVHTANTVLHSGNFGNVSQNASKKLIQLLGRLIDFETGELLIPALKKNIQEESSLEKTWIDQLPEPTNVPSPLFKDKHDYYHRLMFQPTLTINGLMSGYHGDKIKTIIPNEATAILDSRLVASQKCSEVKEDIEKLFKPEIDDEIAKIKWLVALEPTKTPADNELVPIIYSAIKEATGDCLVEPLMPGSVPNYVWTDILSVPVFTIPYANYDQHNHAPNENMLTQSFIDGIKITTTLCTKLI